MKKIFACNWKWFLVAIALSVLLWNGVFSLVCAPKRHQSLHVYVTASACKSNALKSDLLAKVDAKQIKIYTANSTSKSYYDSFVTLAITDCDLVIFETDYFDLKDEVTGEPFAPFEEFTPLEEQTLANYGIDANHYTFVQSSGTNYAVVVYDENLQINLLGDYFTPSDTSKQYCVAVNRYLPNAGQFSSAKHTSDNAFWGLFALLTLQD